MLKINELYFENSQFGGSYQLVEVNPYYKYENKVKTDIIEGYKYTVILLKKGYERLDVKIEGALQIQPGKLDIPVEFEDLKVSCYQTFDSAKKLMLKATADKIKIISK